MKIDDGKLVTTPNEILRLTTEYFKDKFQKKDVEKIQPFTGKPRALTKQITSEEIYKNFKKLNNNRATGEDGIPGELLKYSPKEVHEYVAKMINDMFITHETLNINNGNVITLEKPGKPKGPRKNLRPVTLLNTIRKAISLCTLYRSREKIEKYLSANQSGFRPFRSTADVVWAHRWFTAKTALEEINIYITGIDMSSAFDTIDRNILLEILQDILDEDELRLVRFLLSDTNISIKVKGATEEMPFLGNVGTPQGDSLSPVLFIVYLEAALREIREIHSKEEKIPTEMAYADDVDFISLIKHKDVSEVSKILRKYNLIVNNDKTEKTVINRKKNRNEERWRNVKKVGSLIGDEEDINRRKQLATVAMHKIQAMWTSKDKIKLKTKMKVYRALVKSVLIYNCGTWGVPSNIEEKINTFHRRQLRRVLGIRYPTRITNNKLYEITGEIPITTTMRKARWQLLGHILRRENIPAYKAMEMYLEKTTNKKFRGKPRTHLPIILNQDLNKYYMNDRITKDHNYCHRMKLNTLEDLQEMTRLANDRTAWKIITMNISKAGEAATSVDVAAKIQ